MPASEQCGVEPKATPSGPRANRNVATESLAVEQSAPLEAKEIPTGRRLARNSSAGKLINYCEEPESQPLEPKATPPSRRLPRYDSKKKIGFDLRTENETRYYQINDRVLRRRRK